MAAGVSGGMWGQVRHSINLFATVELDARLISRGGFMVEAGIGLGYLHSFLGAPTYQSAEDGTFTEVADTGRSHLMPLLLWGIGGDLRHGNHAPISIWGRVFLFGQAPYNDGTLAHLATSLGVTLWWDATTGVKQ